MLILWQKTDLDFLGASFLGLQYFLRLLWQCFSLYGEHTTTSPQLEMRNVSKNENLSLSIHLSQHSYSLQHFLSWLILSIFNFRIMKRLLTLLLISSSYFICSSSLVFAVDCGEGWSEGPTGLCISDSDEANSNQWWLQEPTEADKSNWDITIYTSEMIPGADCSCEQWGEMWAWGMWPPTESVSSAGACPLSVPIEKRKYKCTVQPWLWSFQTMFATIIKYFVNIVLLIWVLAIVGLGIAWSWAGGDDAKAKSALKKWGMNIVIGLAILFLFQYILRFLAPWIYE